MVTIVTAVTGSVAMAPITARAYATQAQASHSCRSWRIVSLPSLPLSWAAGISGTSSNDVWVVGGYWYGPSAPVIEHWDGTSWASPPAPIVNGSLHAVAALSSSDVWAVGSRQEGVSFYTLIEHWDGSSWSVITSPSPGTYDFLSAISARSTDDIWAVGSTSYDHGLIEHWDGTLWSVVPQAHADGEMLQGVAAVAAEDAWAVGFRNAGNVPLLERWNGARWNRVRIPTPESAASLYGVAALGPDDAWVVGVSDPGALIEHWDGSTWTPMRSPLYQPGNALVGVAVASPGVVWVVGGYGFGGPPIAEYWDGLTWHLTKPIQENAGFGSIVAFSGLDVWAAGSAANEARVERIGGPCPAGSA